MAMERDEVVVGAEVWVCKPDTPPYLAVVVKLSDPSARLFPFATVTPSRLAGQLRIVYLTWLQPREQVPAGCAL